MIADAEEPYRPWLRLYRRGSAAFQQLEPHHRGTLLEILRYTDSAGRINLAGRTPEEALLLLLGNTRSFRPVLRAALAEGMRIKMCAIEDGHLVFLSWSKYQPSKSRAAAEQEQSNDRAATEQLQSNDRASASKHTESLDTQKDTRGEKRREEKREVDPATPALVLGPVEASEKSKPPEQRVFEHWREAMGSPRSKQSDSRCHPIRKILKLGYTVEDCIAAIDGCRASAWNMGANDRGRKYNTIELIFRNADKVDSFIGMAPAKPAPPSEPGGDPLERARQRLAKQQQAISEQRQAEARGAS